MTQILVVEDELHLAEGLRFNLEAEGYQVRVVETGEAALDILQAPEAPVDVVVLDVMLPGKDGFAVMSELRQAGQFLSLIHILTHIDQQDTNIAETIRHLMFVFEDLLLIDPMGLKEVLAKVDRKILTVALKGTSEQLRNQILGSMSQRGADMLREDMDALGPIKIKEVDAAQQQIIAVVRQLESEGVLSLKGTVGEQYVV